MPPGDGVTVRMYRTGHGDCFLLAFPGEKAAKPVYVLIDCGYKPGSPSYVNTTMAEIGASIRAATGGHVDVAVITHEHQDHVNGITEKNFKDVTIGETWFAWTEDPADDLANRLRKVFEHRLQGLAMARTRLAAAAGGGRAAAAAVKQVEWIDSLLEFELGGDATTFELGAAMAAAGGGGSSNKKSMKLFKDRAKRGVRYLRPHGRVLRVPGTEDIRVFALGPPRNEDQLADLDPRGDEAFQRMALATASPGNYFAAAASSAAGHGVSPFANRHRLAFDRAQSDPDSGPFFNGYYGGDDIPSSFVYRGGPWRGNREVHDNADWRRIDREWLYSAETLALAMNSYTNNSSLVLAFELGKGGKVLLFAADAQRGNWASWPGKDWRDGDETVTARDLLARTVLYKVGHHGSHNATLDGPADSETPNLAWMATGEYRREFAAMITAVREWAITQEWDHPLESIKEALLKKASGRVFQTDCDVEQMEKPPAATDAEWKRFLSRCRGDRLFFDYSVTK